MCICVHCFGFWLLVFFCLCERTSLFSGTTSAAFAAGGVSLECYHCWWSCYRYYVLFFVVLSIQMVLCILISETFPFFCLDGTRAYTLIVPVFMFNSKPFFILWIFIVLFDVCKQLGRKKIAPDTKKKRREWSAFIEGLTMIIWCCAYDMFIKFMRAKRKQDKLMHHSVMLESHNEINLKKNKN